MNKRSSLSHGWGITADNSLIGKYWWFDGIPPTHPIQLSAYTTALFRTRKQARERVNIIKKGYPRAKVVRVSIELKYEF